MNSYFPRTGGDGSGEWDEAPVNFPASICPLQGFPCVSEALWVWQRKRNVFIYYCTLTILKTLLVPQDKKLISFPGQPPDMRRTGEEISFSDFFFFLISFQPPGARATSPGLGTVSPSLGATIPECHHPSVPPSLSATTIPDFMPCPESLIPAPVDKHRAADTGSQQSQLVFMESSAGGFTLQINKYKTTSEALEVSREQRGGIGFSWIGFTRKSQRSQVSLWWERARLERGQEIPCPEWLNLEQNQQTARGKRNFPRDMFELSRDFSLAINS